MNDFYCRRDIMEKFCISRRVIEGYEEIGLVKPSKHDERGGLLYDRETVCRIGFIRICQKMGFELKDIVSLIDLPDDELKIALSNQADIIKEQLSNLQYLLNITCSLASCDGNPRNCNKIFEIYKEDRI